MNHLDANKKQQYIESLLFNYFKKRDISKFYPSNIPATEASKQAYELFIGAHKSCLLEAFQDYQIWAKDIVYSGDFFFFLILYNFCYSIFIPSIFYKYIINYI